MRDQEELPHHNEQEQQQQLILEQQQLPPVTQFSPDQIPALAQEFQKNLATLNPIPYEELKLSLEKQAAEEQLELERQRQQQQQQQQLATAAPSPESVSDEELRQQSLLHKTVAQVKARVALQERAQRQYEQVIGETNKCKQI